MAARLADSPKRPDCSSRSDVCALRLRRSARTHRRVPSRSCQLSLSRDSQLTIADGQVAANGSLESHEPPRRTSRMLSGALRLRRFARTYSRITSRDCQPPLSRRPITRPGERPGELWAEQFSVPTHWLAGSAFRRDHCIPPPQKCQRSRSRAPNAAGKPSDLKRRRLVLFTAPARFSAPRRESTAARQFQRLSLVNA